MSSWHFKYVVNFCVDPVNIPKVSKVSEAIWILYKQCGVGVWDARCLLGTVTHKRERARCVWAEGEGELLAQPAGN